MCNIDRFYLNQIRGENPRTPTSPRFAHNTFLVWITTACSWFQDDHGLNFKPVQWGISSGCIWSGISIYIPIEFLYWREFQQNVYDLWTFIPAPKWAWCQGGFRVLGFEALRFRPWGLGGSPWTLVGLSCGLRLSHYVRIKSPWNPNWNHIQRIEVWLYLMTIYYHHSQIAIIITTPISSLNPIKSHQITIKSPLNPIKFMVNPLGNRHGNHCIARAPRRWSLSKAASPGTAVSELRPTPRRPWMKGS